jgi:hypothetical protein
MLPAAKDTSHAFLLLGNGWGLEEGSKVKNMGIKGSE